MRPTATILEAEQTIRALLADNKAWTTWHDDRTKRTRSTPTLIAIHAPTRIGLAIYLRPRRLHPSENPDTTRLPAGLHPVVWHPALAPDIRAWLLQPTENPPGLLTEPLP